MDFIIPQPMGKPADIIVHPSSPAVPLKKVTWDEAERLDRDTSILVLTELVDRHGLESVMAWARNIASIHGVTFPEGDRS